MVGCQRCNNLVDSKNGVSCSLCNNLQHMLCYPNWFMNKPLAKTIKQHKRNILLLCHKCNQHLKNFGASWLPNIDQMMADFTNYQNSIEVTLKQKAKQLDDLLIERETLRPSIEDALKDVNVSLIADTVKNDEIFQAISLFNGLQSLNETKSNIVSKFNQHNDTTMEQIQTIDIVSFNISGMKSKLNTV